MIGQSASLATLICALAVPAAAQVPCRLALLLALDVSSSMSDRDYALQQNGLAAALVSPDVQHAILSDPSTQVALAVYEWSGRYQQSLIVDWRMLDSPQVLQDTALEILGTSRSYSKYPTSMGYSLGYGAGAFKSAPMCDRRIIDISGDGINNDGFGPQTAYRHFPFQDVTVNGLVVLGKDPDVEWFYQSEVRYGRQAFVEVANTFEDFERAMTAKLFREISEVILGLGPKPDPRTDPKL